MVSVVILFTFKNIPFRQLLNSNDGAIEGIQALAASLRIVLCKTGKIEMRQN